MHLDIEHDPAAGRFHAHADGHACELRYRRDGRRMVITHTRVPAEVGGRGIAGRLTEAALDFARGAGLRVVPQCPYAAAFVARHGGYADLIDTG